MANGSGSAGSSVSRGPVTIGTGQGQMSPDQGWEFALSLIRSSLFCSFALRSFAQNFANFEEQL